MFSWIWIDFFPSCIPRFSSSFQILLLIIYVQVHCFKIWCHCLCVNPYQLHCLNCISLTQRTSDKKIKPGYCIAGKGNSHRKSREKGNEYDREFKNTFPDVHMIYTFFPVTTEGFKHLRSEGVDVDHCYLFKSSGGLYLSVVLERIVSFVLLAGTYGHPSILS